MIVPGYRDHPTEQWDPIAPVDPAEAEDFLRQCYLENPRLGPVEPRLAIVRAQIAATGSYVHTTDELAYGAKMAWRNASRCIGRLYWRSLVVLDRRRARTADEIFSLLVHHLQAAGGAPNAGAIRPVISIFAAGAARPAVRPGLERAADPLRRLPRRGRRPGRRPAPGAVHRRDAGLRLARQGRGVRRAAAGHRDPGRGLRLYELPERAILEVPLTHPEFGWFAELGLRWHAVPAIANMRLTIGGVHYPLAPFNGWYMGTEIGARNLADADRYNMLPIVAARMGLDTSRESTLWRDRALVELNRAVLWSFEQAGVKITDHHTESQRFLAHLRNEEKAGPAGAGRLELDRAADVRRHHPGLPPLLRGGGPAARVLPGRRGDLAGPDGTRGCPRAA